jgi:hypothetical protein
MQRATFCNRRITGDACSNEDKQNDDPLHPKRPFGMMRC